MLGYPSAALIITSSAPPSPKKITLILNRQKILFRFRDLKKQTAVRRMSHQQAEDSQDVQAMPVLNKLTISDKDQVNHRQYHSPKPTEIQGST